MTFQKSVAVFCASSEGENAQYASVARRFGEDLAMARFRLVYGGAGIGLMRVLADAALSVGGEVVGVIPKALCDQEMAYSRISDLRQVTTMAERKNMMISLSDAFVALPGGFGTLDELFEVVTLHQIGEMRKPVIVVNTQGYYDGVRAFTDRAIRDGLIRPKHRDIIRWVETPEAALSTLQTLL